MPKQQVHIILKGHVQGIGFRFTAERIALQLKVTGWVKNLDNGNVEVVAEADKEVLDDFLDKLRSHFSRYIRDEEINFSEATGRFKDFQIKF